MDEPELERPPAPPSWRDLLRRLLERDGGDVDGGGRPPPRALAAAGALVLGVVVAAVAVWALLLRAPPAPPIEASIPFATGDPGPVAGGGASGTGGAGGAGAGADGAGALPGGPVDTAAPAVLVVHAAGAVVAPGLVQVPAGARVADVLAAAGGPSPDADLDAVNLAAPVADGDRVWFPRAGEVPPGQAVGVVPAAGGGGSGGGGPVDINTATAEELDALPGIGPSIAAAIVQHRERDGPFRSVDELLDVPGIGDAKLAQIRDRVRV